MGNYFNELRWKIIRANNPLQFIHQVTISLKGAESTLDNYHIVGKHVSRLNYVRPVKTSRYMLAVKLYRSA